MANKKIIDVDTLSSLADSDSLFVNSGGSLKQVSAHSVIGHVGCAASARGSASSLSLTASVIGNITLDTWITRTDTAFTFSDGGIKCPYDGVVIISGSAYVAMGTYTASGGCYLFKGTTELSPQYIDGVSGGVSAGTQIVSVSAGDIIYLKARRSTTGTCAPNNPATHLDIIYIQ